MVPCDPPKLPTTPSSSVGPGIPWPPRSGVLGSPMAASSLDGRSAGVSETPASCSPPTLRSRTGDDSTPATWVCGGPTSLGVGS
jgi:hypothetical protein